MFAFQDLNAKSWLRDTRNENTMYTSLEQDLMLTCFTHSRQKSWSHHHQKQLERRESWLIRITRSLNLWNHIRRKPLKYQSLCKVLDWSWHGVHLLFAKEAQQQQVLQVVIYVWNRLYLVCFPWWTQPKNRNCILTGMKAPVFNQSWDKKVEGSMKHKMQVLTVY